MKAKKLKATKKSGGEPEDTGLHGDDRYQEIAGNPLFREIRRKERKVVVDKRFKGIFDDKRFATTEAKIDKHGRPISFGKHESLSKVYDLGESESDESDKSSSAGSDDEEESEPDERQIRLDLARGEGNVSSSDEEEGELDEEVENLVEVDDAWGELDKGVRRVEWAGRRFAVCNLDWDRLKAADIVVILNSFKPPTGQIDSLSIYLSDFGVQKLEEENQKGPVFEKLRNATKQRENGEELDEETANAIRAYQLDRMKYCYAVAECDTEQTAIAIYEACDGVEYENSGVRLDLRFIPDDMEFDESRLKEKVSGTGVNVEKYKPKRFESFALNNSNAKLTWDETDPDRIRATSDAFKEDADLDQFDYLLASGSEDDEENAQNTLRTLLASAGIVKDEDRTPKQVEPNKSASEDELDSEEEEEKDDSTEKKGTPFQKYLERRKEKRRERKAMLKQKAREKRGELHPKKEEEGAEAKSRPAAKRPKKDQIAAELPVDLGDERFSALFTNSAFAIDKTHSHYKGGALADRQVEEKIKRAKTKPSAAAKPVEEEAVPPAVEDVNLERLKKKTQSMAQKKRKAKSEL